MSAYGAWELLLLLELLLGAARPVRITVFVTPAPVSRERDNNRVPASDRPTNCAGGHLPATNKTHLSKGSLPVPTDLVTRQSRGRERKKISLSEYLSTPQPLAFFKLPPIQDPAKNPDFPHYLLPHVRPERTLVVSPSSSLAHSPICENRKLIPFFFFFVHPFWVSAEGSVSSSPPAAATNPVVIWKGTANRVRVRILSLDRVRAEPKKESGPKQRLLASTALRGRVILLATREEATE